MDISVELSWLHHSNSCTSLLLYIFSKVLKQDSLWMLFLEIFRLKDRYKVKLWKKIKYEISKKDARNPLWNKIYSNVFFFKGKTLGFLKISNNIFPQIGLLLPQIPDLNSSVEQPIVVCGLLHCSCPKLSSSLKHHESYAVAQGKPFLWIFKNVLDKAAV